MKVCSDGHDEVAFEGGYYQQCPVCALVKKHDDKVDALATTVDELRDTNAELRRRMEDLEAGV